MDDFNRSDYIVPNNRMTSKGCGRKRSWRNLRYYLAICVERPRKTYSNRANTLRGNMRLLEFPSFLSAINRCLAVNCVLFWNVTANMRSTEIANT
jgi:hypothetical protein